MTLQRTLALALTLTVSLGLAACGGGGGGSAGAAPPAVVTPEGSYWITGAAADLGGPTRLVYWGTMDLSASTAQYVLQANNATTVSAPSPLPALPYSVDANRNFTAQLGPSALAGRMSASGKLIHQAVIAPGSDPLNLFAIRKGGTHATADLAETYAGALQVPGGILFFGHFQFDGAGNYNFTYDITNGLASASNAVAGTYAVAPDGTLTMQFSGVTLTGMVGIDGDLIGLAGGVNSGDAPIYGLLVRRAPGTASNATFSGEYMERALGFDLGVPNAIGRNSSIVADGAGTFSYAGTENRDGVLAPFVDPANTSTVALDGALTLQIGAQSIWGYILEDGEIAMYAGALAPSNPRLGVLIR